MHYEEMIELLKRGGIDTETFDSRSAKSLSDLHAEIRDRDIALLIHEGRAVRVALTVKILIVVAGTEYIRQTQRVYPSGKVVVRKAFATITETRKRGECAFDAVVRGLQEECGIVVGQDQIRIPSLEATAFLSDSHQIHSPQQEIDEHESTVYEGLRTIAHVEHFEVHLVSRPWPEQTRIVDDNGVQIHLEYWRLPIPEIFTSKIRALS